MPRSEPKRHFMMTVTEEHKRGLLGFARDHGFEGDLQEALRMTSLMGMSADPASIEVVQRARAGFNSVRRWAMERLRRELETMANEVARAQREQTELGDFSQLEGGDQ